MKRFILITVFFIFLLPASCWAIGGIYTVDGVLEFARYGVAFGIIFSVLSWVVFPGSSTSKSYSRTANLVFRDEESGEYYAVGGKKQVYVDIGDRIVEAFETVEVRGKSPHEVARKMGWTGDYKIARKFGIGTSEDYIYNGDEVFRGGRRVHYPTLDERLEAEDALKTKRLSRKEAERLKSISRGDPQFD